MSYVKSYLQSIADDFFRRNEGLFFGQLDETEKALFRKLQQEGMAEINYAGPAGSIGLGKVRRVLNLHEEAANVLGTNTA